MGLQAGLRRLAKGGTPARLLIIDDGWQQMGEGDGLSAGQEGRAGWGIDTPACGQLLAAHAPASSV